METLAFSSRPAPRCGGPRGGFDVGFPCHSACVFLQSPFFVSPPPRHAGGPHEVFYGDLPYHGACVFLQLLFFAFFLASQPSRSEVWQWVLRSRIFDSMTCSIIVREAEFPRNSHISAYICGSSGWESFIVRPLKAVNPFSTANHFFGTNHLELV